MKLLKRLGIILLAIIVLLVVISFMLPSKVHVERSAAIAAPANVVFMQVNNLRNWNNWMPYNKIDPEMKIEYTGKEEGTGAGYSWSSENGSVGNGNVTITESRPNELIVTALDFMENGVATGSFRFEPSGSETKVTWGMDMDMGMNPIARYLGLFMDQLMGKDFEKGLKDLKAVSESYTPPVVPELNAAPADSATVTSKPS